MLTLLYLDFIGRKEVDSAQLYSISNSYKSPSSRESKKHLTIILFNYLPKSPAVLPFINPTMMNMGSRLLPGATNLTTTSGTHNPSLTGTHNPSLTSTHNPMSMQQMISGGDQRSMFVSSDENVMMRQIQETHTPDGRHVDVKPLLNIVEDILNRATLIDSAILPVSIIIFSLLIFILLSFTIK